MFRRVDPSEAAAEARVGAATTRARKQRSNVVRRPPVGLRGGPRAG